jgi:hypothetical protein
MLKNNEQYDRDFFLVMGTVKADCLFLDLDEPVATYDVITSIVTATSLAYYYINDGDTYFIMSNDIYSLAGNALETQNDPDHTDSDLQTQNGQSYEDGIPDSIEFHAMYREDEQFLCIASVPKNAKPQDLNLVLLPIMIFNTIHQQAATTCQFV